MCMGSNLVQFIRVDVTSRRNDCGCGNGCGFDVCPSITIGSENNTVVILNVRGIGGTHYKK